MSLIQLRSVSEDDDDEREDNYGRRYEQLVSIPPFEGHEVDFTRVKLSAAGDLEIDAINRIDDIVRMQVEGRVVRVDHVADEKTGKMKRVHTIKVVDAVQLPWDTEVHPHEG